ncbi:MAG: hypothetical protein ACI93N_001198, partial [Flavobacteriaceae bacterium]
NRLRRDNAGFFIKQGVFEITKGRTGKVAIMLHNGIAYA